MLGWTRAHWILRTFSVIALVFCVIAAFTVVNQNYDYYPTLARLLGKDAANFADLPQLKAIRDEVRRTGKLPTHGETIAVTIPATVSKFQTGQAYVYLPPVWFKNPEPQLPLIELIAGVPGEPSDWTRAGYADTTSTAFAEQHHGGGPDPGHPGQQRQPDQRQRVLQQRASGTRRPTWSRTSPPTCRPSSTPPSASTPWPWPACRPAAPAPPCSPSAIRQVFSTFASYSGYASPTYENDNAQQTIAQLYGGSKANYEAHNPVNLLTGNQYPGRPVGSPPARATPNPWPRPDSCRRWPRRPGCRCAGRHRPGDHSFAFWAAAFRPRCRGCRGGWV